MRRLEEITPGSAIKGILPDSVVSAINAQWFGSEALELTYKDAVGRVGNQLLYRHDEPRIEVVAAGRPWSFDGDGALFRLVSEAQRIRLAHLFDPVLAVERARRNCPNSELPSSNLDQFFVSTLGCAKQRLGASDLTRGLHGHSCLRVRVGTLELAMWDKSATMLQMQFCFRLVAVFQFQSSNSDFFFD